LGCCFASTRADFSESDMKTSAKMTKLRDRFARQAISLFPLSEADLRNFRRGEEPDHELVAEFCYGLADAMLAQRLKH